MYYFYSASMVEGTCSSILKDNRGHIVGVSYKDKETGEVKVFGQIIIIAIYYRLVDNSSA